MKIAPLKLTDPWLHRLARDGEADTETLSAVPCEISVRMETVSVLHHGIDQNHRPYLHLSGQIVQIQPDVALPYGITALPFRSGSEPTFDAFYEFDTEQLLELVRKGYFGSRFQVPESMTGLVWELPAEVDFLLVAPERMQQPPLAFVGVRNQNNTEFDEGNSGYTLAEYFPDYSVEDSVPVADDRRPAVSQRSDQIEDLFADEEFDAVHRGHGGPSARVPVSVGGAREEVPQGVFDRVLQGVETERRAAESTMRPGVDYAEDTPEGLLRSRIQPGVAAALSDAAARGSGSGGRGAESANGGDTDAGDFLDLD
ncbi:AAA family ATPase [Nocardiopsis sp. NPDC058789]|uniref:AAA family ATPase n=1 Tax=Nocardiopsis sp. NPDC058789 TaxID=3346634 RepID=UPI00366E577E